MEEETDTLWSSSSFTVVLRFSFLESMGPIVLALVSLCAYPQALEGEGQSHHRVHVTQTPLFSFHILSTLGEHGGGDVCRDYSCEQTVWLEARMSMGSQLPESS